MGVSELTAAFAAAAFAVTGFIRYLIVRTALKGTAPQDRPKILRSLATMFRAEWHLGPLRRERPREGNESSSIPPSPRPVGGSDEVAPTDST